MGAYQRGRQIPLSLPPATFTGNFLADFSDAVYEGDMDRALHKLRSFLSGVPSDLAAKDEKSFQAQLYLVFRLVGADIATEVRTSTGRIDAVVHAPDATFVIELKYRREDQKAPIAQDAIDQINDRDYCIPYEGGDKPVVKVGVVYDEGRRTIDEDWLIVR